MPQMKLITKEIEEAFRKHPLYSQDGLGDNAKVLVKFFDPMGRGTWYITEANKITKEDGTTDYEMFGLCVMQEPEYGYVLLSQLESIGGMTRTLNISGRNVPVKGIPVERDRFVPPMKYTVKECWESDHPGRPISMFAKKKAPASVPASGKKKKDAGGRKSLLDMIRKK